MNFNSDFKFDLHVGQVHEEKLARILKEKKIEVKTDFIAHKTGNIAVEYMCRGKPSGIATTQADYYAFIIPHASCKEIVLLVDVVELKKISRLFYKNGKTKNMGDSNQSVSVLIPIDKLFNMNNNGKKNNDSR